uniref:Extended synaptotagmin-like protein 2a n=1 Tax=Sphaeramia orbicularis TaxID=375764 RepID=A0A673B3Y8_9TELE
MTLPSSPTGSTVGPPLPPEDLNEEPQSSLADVTEMWIRFVKTFAIIFPIYILGYFEFSFSWVLIGLAMLFYWRKNYGNKNFRINRALALLEQEDKVVKQSIPTCQLPPWVHYPDVERTVKQMWPFICQFIDKLFRETIEPAVKTASPYLSSFCFTKIDMGDKPLRVNGVKVYTENVDKRQVIMDLEISFVGNTEIGVDIKKYYCRAGIKSIQLHGVMRVVMEPLLGDMPLIGAVTLFFLKKPLLDINWTGLTNMLDIPGVNGLSDSIIQDIIHSHLVLPNRITIPLVGEAHLAQLRFPMPKGVLRIHFIEAQDLLGKDKFLGGLIKGKSDPYGVIRLGTQLFQSKVIHETVNPKWNEVYEALVYEHSGQNLQIELFDEDTDKDDFLGSLTIDMAELQKDQRADEWFVMDEVATGKLHVKLEWLSMLSTPDKLDQVLMSIKADRGQANDGLSSALLVIFLDSARNLPVRAGLNIYKYILLFMPGRSGKKVTSDPSPFVQFTVGHKSYESKTRYKTNEPVWEEAFTFLVHNPKTQDLEVEVRRAFPDLIRSLSKRASGRGPESEGATAQVARSLGSSEVGEIGEGGMDEGGRSTSNLAISSSQQYLAGAKEPTPSIASDISNPYAAQELQHRLQQLQNGSGPSYLPLGEIQLTIRQSSQRNKLIVVVHACRNLIAFTDHGSDPYVRLYLLPDKRRSGRRKTQTFKKTLNPVYDQTFEFSVSIVELHRRTLDVAVKNGGGLLSKHKGLLGKVLVDLTHEDITKGWTQWLVRDPNCQCTQEVFFFLVTVPIQKAEW